MPVRYVTTRMRLIRLRYLLAWWLLSNAFLWQSGYGLAAQIGRNLLCSASADELKTAPSSAKANSHCSWCVQLNAADVLPLGSAEFTGDLVAGVVPTKPLSVRPLLLIVRAYRARAPPELQA